MSSNVNHRGSYLLNECHLFFGYFWATNKQWNVGDFGLVFARGGLHDFWEIVNSDSIGLGEMFFNFNQHLPRLSKFLLCRPTPLAFIHSILVVITKLSKYFYYALCLRKKRHPFYRAACNADAVLRWDFGPSICPSVCLSVKRVHCDKTEEKSVQIFIPCDR